MATELKTWVSVGKVTFPLDSVSAVWRGSTLASKVDAVLATARAKKAEAGYGDLDEVVIDVTIEARIYYNVEQEVEGDEVAAPAP